MSDGGKGSAPRPLSVDQKTFQENWDAIFRNNTSDSSVDDAGVLRRENERDCGGSQHGTQDKPSK